MIVKNLKPEPERRLRQSFSEADSLKPKEAINSAVLLRAFFLTGAAVALSLPSRVAVGSFVGSGARIGGPLLGPFLR